MKKTTLFLLTLCSLAAQAQIQAFNNAARNDFYGIGGYSFTKQTFPDGVQVNPYVVSGPLPQNDFSFAASADGGITNRLDYISTTNTNTAISIKLFGNNVRKFGCRVIGINSAMTGSTSDIISIVATTNLGYNVIQTGGGTSGRFVGFNLIENDNDYIVSITASFQTPPSSAAFLTIYDIIVGDNTPQNVALNFDGVDDYVTTNSNVGNFNTLQNFTVECWIKPDPTQTTQSGNNPDENDIISKWAGLNAGVNNKYPFVIRYLNQNRTNVNERGRIRVGKWDGTNFPRITSTIAVNDGRWHHVAFVRDEGLFTLYIDGVANGNGVNATTTTTNGTIIDDAINRVNNTTPLQFGRRGNNESYFKGEIDEVRIWLIGKTATQIADERFCKTANSNNLHVSYNFSNGVPHDNNVLISQVQDKIQNIGGAEHGTLNNFAKTGDASNFVTGQVKYVRTPINGNGSTWSNAFFNLQSALSANTCNDLFEVWVAKGNAFYKPDASNAFVPFNIPSGMRIYGGFAGDEKSINQRNLALIHSTNATTLSGDLAGNDTPFNFTTNRTDNSNTVVQITGSNASLDGFTIRGGRITGVNIPSGRTNPLIKHNKVIDNKFGVSVAADNTTIANSIISGNQVDGVNTSNATALTINNSLIANNGNSGIYMNMNSGNHQIAITNCTIAANNGNGIGIVNNGAAIIYSIKNTINYGNLFTGIAVENNSGSAGGGISNSLIQGKTSTNPQFVSLLGSGFGSLSLANMGDYRLKWCSLAINAGNNGDISPLDLDRNPRNFGGTADIGAYEFLGNTPSQVAISDITGTIDSPTYAGGAIQTITSTAKILAPAGAIDFKAPNSIILSPGFEARGVGKYFKAQIGANVGCSN